MALPSETVRQPAGAVALRRLAADFRAGGDAAQLMAALGRAFAVFPELAGLQPEPVAAPPAFAADRLTLPIVGAEGPLGLLRLGPNAQGEFHPGQVHLGAAVADFAATIVQHALRANNRSTTREMLALTLGDLPIGVAGYGEAGRLLYSNAAANLLLGNSVPSQWSEIHPLLAPAASAPASFVRREGAKIVHVTLRQAGAEARGALIVVDLVPRLTAFRETVAAEVYRALVEQRGLTVGVLAGPPGSLVALTALESARPSFGAEARVGLVDPEVAAIVTPAMDRAVLWRELRALAGPGGEPLRVGVSTLRPDGDTPEAVLARALAVMEPQSRPGTPDLLVFDPSPSVTDALAFMLRHEYVVTCANQWEKALSLAQMRPYDGMILELPQSLTTAAGDAVRSALDAQPGARPFFVTDQPGPWELPGLGLPVAPVFQKPFQVTQLRARLREVFSGAGK